MRRVVSVVLFTMATVGATLAQQTRDRSAAAPRTGTSTISGIVVSDDDVKRPIRRVTVSVVEEGGGVSGRTTVTNDAGIFAVTGLPAGRYVVTATKGAYLPATYGAPRPRPGTVRTGTAIVVAEGQRVSDLALPMMRGGVITGIIRDDVGRPVRGVGWMVAYFTRSPQTGERILAPFQGAAGVSTTDSRGVYRIYGLPPGEYVVAAGIPATDLLVTTEIEKTRATTVPPLGAPSPASPTRPRVGYARVYYPGTTVPADAAPIRVGPGEERAGIDFSLQLVPNARVEGTLTGVDGAPVSGSTVLAFNDRRPAGVDATGVSARTDALGQFSLRGLPPGSYTIVAATSMAVWGNTNVVVQGDDVRANIQLRSTIGLAGTVAVEGDGPDTAPDLSRVRLRFFAESAAMRVSSAGLDVSVTADGHFKTNLIPGRYRMVVTAPGRPGGPAHWIVSSAIIGKQQAADQSFEVREGDNLTDTTLTLTSRVSELSGRMVDARGRAAPEFFVIVYPTDQAQWGWQARRIKQARPGVDGSFAFTSLPAGEYFLAAVTDVEQNEWFDPEFLKAITGASIRVSLAAGEKKTQLIQVK